MTSLDTLVAGREAFDAHRWRDACHQLTAADNDRPLEPDDLELLGTAAYMAGDPSWQAAWARAHQTLRERGEAAKAARMAFWLVFGHFNAGEIALGGGWLARAQRLVDELGGDCVEAGYLLLPAAIAGCDSQPDESLVAFRRALQFGERFGDADLVAFARHGEARCIIALGDPPTGMALLDEVLVDLAAGDLSPIVTGDTYCGAIEACHLTFDVRRAREWTAALNRWCESQPGLEAFRGQCLVYVAAVTQIRGDWNGALDVASQACRHLAEPVLQPAIGAAQYQRGELQRLRGEFTAAEESYRLAAEHGRDPQPGLAQLRLATGHLTHALAGIRRALDEVGDPLPRSALLSPCVEIMIASGDVPGARRSAEELTQIAEAFSSPFLRARAAHATGSVLIAEGQHREALIALREASAAFRELDAPFESSCARVLVGLACRELGDDDGAKAEFQAARHVFEALGAAPELRHLDSLSGQTRVIPSPYGTRARHLAPHRRRQDQSFDWR